MLGAKKVMGEGKKSNIPDVSEDWRLWCRLCAKADIQNVNIFLKDEDVFTTAETKTDHESLLIGAISKYFNVEMIRDEQFPIQLCTDCFLLITSLIKFNERVIKVQQMYLALRHLHHNASINLPGLRLKYGILENEQPHQFMYRSITEIQLHEEKLKAHEHEKNRLSGEAGVGIILQDARTAVEIKRENTNNVTPLTDEDVWDFENEDAEGEDPFGSDAELDAKDGEEVSGQSENSGYAKNSLMQVKECNEDKNETNSTPTAISNNLDKKNKFRGQHCTKSEINSSKNSTYNEVGLPTGAESVEMDKTYTCIECAKVFKRLSNYRSHMERKHAKTDAVPRFVCTECSASFNTATQLNHHRTIKHLPIEKRRIVPCHYCEQKFPTKQYVVTHIKFVHMNERSFICEECGEAVRSKGQLKQHMLTHTDYAPFECETCKKCFKNQERLKNHMETHNPNKHVCAECGLQLNSRITLNRHLLVHSDVMRHKCDYCGRAFKRAKALKNHLILHTGLKPYSCDFCDRTFANGSNCRTHKRKAHPEELAAQEAAGAKSYTRNIPKLAVLKSVTQAAENLAPVVSKQSGNFAFGKKPKLLLNDVGTVSKKQRKLYNESIAASMPAGYELVEQSNSNGSKPLLLNTELQSNSKNENDNNKIDNQNIPTIDNIYSHLMKPTVVSPASTIHPLHLDIKRSRSEVSSPAAPSFSTVNCLTAAPNKRNTQ
ncbi:zinc finger protein weckle-like isoform X2 [Eurosta solidaginis]|uniref:zinc finger protein weckle-like isoform X2 n=1 Tax=Eurosta solidaginis TaxID=178769 RepID=UPI003530B861